jgi:hypothetical protein
VLIDDDMFDRVSKYTWCVQKFKDRFYATRKHKRTITILMHRFILNVSDPKIEVDHIDNDGLNNQSSNLRCATHSQNLCNRGAVKNSKSKYKGVGWVTSHKKWRASIQKDKVLKVLGYFSSEIDAAKAYDAAAKTIHGEFAYLNFKY